LYAVNLLILLRIFSAGGRRSAFVVFCHQTLMAAAPAASAEGVVRFAGEGGRVRERGQMIIFCLVGI
jgi:hypothetical protein